MLTDKERFKVAVLHHAQQQGWALEQTHALIKQALLGLERLPGKALDLAGALGKPLAGAAGTGLLLAPFALGGLGGHLAGRSGNLSDEDIAEAKKQELIAAYNSARNDMLQRNRLKSKHQDRKPPARSLL